MKSRSLKLTLIILTLPVSACAAEPTKFCVNPGDRIELLRKNCPSVKPITEYTEEGEVTSYIVSSEGYTATVEPEGGIIEIIRFRQNPLPHSNLRIGDSFSKVRSDNSDMKIVYGVGEHEYLALSDKKKGVYISFDTAGLSRDWLSSLPDEAKLSGAKVVALNLVLPE